MKAEGGMNAAGQSMPMWCGQDNAAGVGPRGEVWKGGPAVHSFASLFVGNRLGCGAAELELRATGSLHNANVVAAQRQRPRAIADTLRGALLGLCAERWWHGCAR